MMKYHLFVRSEAARDLETDGNWYKNKLESYYAAALYDEAGRTIEAIVERPNSFPLVYRNVRRALTTRFAYAIYFSVDVDKVMVMAVLHGTQDHDRLFKREAK